MAPKVRNNRASKTPGRNLRRWKALKITGAVKIEANANRRRSRMRGFSSFAPNFTQIGMEAHTMVAMIPAQCGTRFILVPINILDKLFPIQSQFLIRRVALLQGLWVQPIARSKTSYLPPSLGFSDFHPKFGCDCSEEASAKLISRTNPGAQFR